MFFNMKTKRNRKRKMFALIFFHACTAKHVEFQNVYLHLFLSRNMACLGTILLDENFLNRPSQVIILTKEKNITRLTIIVAMLIGGGQDRQTTMKRPTLDIKAMRNTEVSHACHHQIIIIKYYSSEKKLYTGCNFRTNFLTSSSKN